MSEGKLSSGRSTSEEKQSGGDEESSGLSFRLGGRFRAPLSSDLDLPAYAPDDDEKIVNQVAKRFRSGPSIASAVHKSGESLDQQEEDVPEVDASFLLTALDVEEQPAERPSTRTLEEPTQSGSGLRSDTDRLDDLPLVDVEPLSTAQDDLEVAPVVRPVVCPTCHAENPGGMRFCVECGGALARGAGPGAREKASPKAGLDFGAEPLPDRQPPPSSRAASEENPWAMQLVSINEDGTDGEAVSLEYLETTVGREGDSRFPSDAFLSPKHARFHIEKGRLFIEDLYSLNGTFIKLRDETRLTPGDTILMGRQVLRFERFEQSITPKTKSSDGTRYMGSPAPGGSFKILQIGIGGVVQNVYCLPEAGAVLGREKGDIVFPHDKFMSGRHAQIYAGDDGHCYLVDLNSSNGTWVKIWEKTELDNKDFIFMGQQLFRVRYAS